MSQVYIWGECHFPYYHLPWVNVISPTPIPHGWISFPFLPSPIGESGREERVEESWKIPVRALRSRSIYSIIGKNRQRLSYSKHTIQLSHNDRKNQELWKIDWWSSHYLICKHSYYIISSLFMHDHGCDTIIQIFTKESSIPWCYLSFPGPQRKFLHYLYR